jgi:hypothetical protein
VQAIRSKQSMEAWFKDIAGSKPLAQLSRKVPTFHKKDEIFSTLCEYSVPLVRAAWFIKMTAAHNMATQDNRMRRRQAADQSIGKDSYLEFATYSMPTKCIMLRCHVLAKNFNGSNVRSLETCKLAYA